MREIARDIQIEGIEKFGRYYGKYAAIVHDNNDTENRAQLKIEVPEVWGAGVVGDVWAQAVAMNGASSTFLNIPEIGDIVFVEFLDGGDPRFPIWTGTPIAPRFVTPQMNKDTAIWQRKDSIITMRDNATSINGDTVILGNIDNASNSAVLGDELVNLLDTLLSELMKLKTLTGTPMSADNILKFTQMKLDLDLNKKILSKKVKLD